MTGFAAISTGDTRSLATCQSSRACETCFALSGLSRRLDLRDKATGQAAHCPIDIGVVPVKPACGGDSRRVPETVASDIELADESERPGGIFKMRSEEVRAARMTNESAVCMQVAIEGVAKRAKAAVFVVVVLAEGPEKVGPFAERVPLFHRGHESGIGMRNHDDKLGRMKGRPPTGAGGLMISPTRSGTGCGDRRTEPVGLRSRLRRHGRKAPFRGR